MPNDKTEKYFERFRVLKKDREEWVPEWIDIRDNILPRTGFFEDAGDKPNDARMSYEEILDGTATRSLRVLAAGMQGGLTSPARPWFRLKLEDEDLMEYMPVKVWLETVEQRMYARFARSNFYNSIHRLYQEEAGYGTSCVVTERDQYHLFRFQVMTCGEYYLAESDRGVVDTMYRKVWFQTRQLEQKFGKGSLDRAAQEALEKNNVYQWWPVLHCIQPRKDYDPTKLDNKNMAYESTYMHYDADQGIIKESGYVDQPFAAPRWTTIAGDAYGRSPGTDVLGDVKMLQQMSTDMYQALELIVRPPIKMSGSLKDALPYMAGEIIYADNSDQSKSIEPVFKVDLRIQELVAAIQDVRLQIREGLYNDLFLMLIEPKPNMTATEVAERHEEKLLMLGPVIERQFYELLDPIIDRVFTLMWEAGEIPQPPEELMVYMRNKGEFDIKVEYVSLLAQAQKLVSTQSIRATTEYALAVAPVIPDVLDYFNHDKALKEFADATGAPPELIRTDEIVQKIRKQRAEQVAREKAMQEQAAAMQGAKVMSDTKMDDDNALTELKDSLEGA